MLEYIESWSRTHHNEIRRLDCQNCRNHTDTRTGKPEEHSQGHGGGHNNNQQQQVPGGVGGKFGAQAAGAFSNYMGGKVQHPRFSSAMRSVKAEGVPGSCMEHHALCAYINCLLIQLRDNFVLRAPTITSSSHPLSFVLVSLIK
ncbi:hypothetical protein A4X13_0g8741 [Tilletia indica]|uniref:Uncharacterized protein n=1 Tax=Tilletia indica TaxID=43049 RepID=A0A8T8SDR5_9BASI|nr:hypothetical protein A4X13_0g8741 [Tilletia indica]